MDHSGTSSASGATSTLQMNVSSASATLDVWNSSWFPADDFSAQFAGFGQWTPAVVLPKWSEGAIAII